jgi:type II secretory pathway component GspD/PulD (secretin)
MNHNAIISVFVAAICAVALHADEAKAPAPRAVPLPSASAAKDSPQKSASAAKADGSQASGADEVPVTMFDDSADAAKARPVVKLAPLPAGGAPKAADAMPPANALAGAAPQAADATGAKPAPRATGAQIAAKYLLGDEMALVDITSDDATISDILRQFRKTTGANIIYAESSNLQQRVSINLKRVPWLQAMTSILASRGFRVESSEGIHFVKEDKLAVPIFTRSFVLNHASADELATLFNESYGVVKDGKVIKRVATSFQGANTVVVTADERTLADCEKIIKSVDKAVPQIYIEARFIELSNQAMHNLGLKWDKLNSWKMSVKDVSAGIEYNNGRLNKYESGYTDTYYTPKKYVASTTDGKTTYQDLSDGSSALDYRTKNFMMSDSIVSPSRLNSPNAADMIWRNARVFSGQLAADEFELAMSAFEQMEDTKIFSNPKIIVSNGKEALFDRTTKFPHITLTSQHDTQSGYTKSDAKLEVIPGEDNLFSKKQTAFFSWGITLTVKPRISPDGLISVEIVPAISDLDTSVTSDGFYHISGGSDAPYGSYPIVLFKRLTTEFTMKDGATAVIGGLSKTEEGDIDSGIPYLRKIPWVGPHLFGWKSRGKVQKEILIFVTVGIADPANLPEDIGLPKNAVKGREYLDGRSFEPGDRPNAAKESILLDLRPVDGRVNAQERAENRQEFGTVTITPSEP